MCQRPSRHVSSPKLRPCRIEFRFLSSRRRCYIQAPPPATRCRPRRLPHDLTRCPNSKARWSACSYLPRRSVPAEHRLCRDQTAGGGRCARRGAPSPRPVAASQPSIQATGPMLRRLPAGGRDFERLRLRRRTVGLMRRHVAAALSASSSPSDPDLATAPRRLPPRASSSPASSPTCSGRRAFDANYRRHRDLS